MVVVTSGYHSCFRCSLYISSAYPPVKCKAVGTGNLFSLVGNRETGGDWGKYGIRGVQGRKLVYTICGQRELKKEVKSMQIGTTYGTQWEREGTQNCMPVPLVSWVEKAHGRDSEGLRERVRGAGRSVKEEWKDVRTCYVGECSWEWGGGGRAMDHP